jgi:hypothetical protein
MHILEIEYRLYYDELGNILYYTCEKPEGIYLVIDAQTYAESRYDIKVVDGVIVKLNTVLSISKLELSESGIKCPIEDVSIVINDDYDGKINHWSCKHVEYN